MTTSPQNHIATFTDLSRALIADKKGDKLQSHIEEIDEKIAALEEHIEKGISFEEKKRADKEKEALEAAKRVINLFWHSFHHNQ